jgi:hypothetical protein
MVIKTSTAFFVFKVERVRGYIQFTDVRSVACPPLEGLPAIFFTSLGWVYPPVVWRNGGIDPFVFTAGGK